MTDSRRPAARLALGVAFVAALAVAWLERDRFAAEPLLAALEAARSWGPVAFVALYAVLSLLLVPTLPLNLGAGVLWGAWWGGLYSALGATLGGVGAFLVARYLLGGWLDRRWRGGRWDAVRDELAKNDWKIVAFTRLSPVFPTAILNYLYGVTPLTLGTFVWTTLVFLLPGSVVFAGLGDLAGQVVLAGESRRLATEILAVAAAVTVLVVLRWLFRRRAVAAAAAAGHYNPPPMSSRSAR